MEKVDYHNDDFLKKKGKGDELFYGYHPVIKALESGQAIHKVLVKKGLQPSHFKTLYSLCKERKIPLQQVPSQKLQQYTQKNHQGVIALSSRISLLDFFSFFSTLLKQKQHPFLLFLDGITDVRNFGAIARTALCVGVDGMVVPAKHSVWINEEAVKASAGALFQIPVVRISRFVSAFEALKRENIPLLACSEKGEKNLYQYCFPSSLAILVGSEGRGIPREHLEYCDEIIKIPMQHNFSSLNVSVATAVVLYEILRQRNFSG